MTHCLWDNCDGHHRYHLANWDLEYETGIWWDGDACKMHPLTL
jgi:hypothetical protein